MRTIILRLLIAVGLIAAGLALAPAANATGGGDPEPCVPKDAWTETIEHPAVTHVEHHEAVTHREYRYTRSVEETITQWHFVKYTHTKTRPANGDWSAYGPWAKWEPVSHESWETTNVEALGSPAFHGSGTTNGTEWYREWQARNTGETRQVPGGTHTETTDWLPGPPAGEGWMQIDERVVTDHAAYDETVVDKEAWTETIEHSAVVCTEEPPAFEEYEVCALWSVDNPGSGVDWPQTRVETDVEADCPTPPATCEPQRFQYDVYWIRDADDEAYLAGLQHLTGPQDDVRLEPHDYRMIDLPAKSDGDCTPPPVCEPDHNGDEPGCGQPPVDVCENIPGDQSEIPPGHVGDDETGECVLIPEEPVLPPNKPEKPAKPSASPPTTLLTQAPAQPALVAQPAAAALPATGAPASSWLVLLGAGLVLGGVVLTRRSRA